MATSPSTFLPSSHLKTPSFHLYNSLNFTNFPPIFGIPRHSSNSRFRRRSRLSTTQFRTPTYAFLKEGSGQVTKKWVDVTGLNYWVVRDYYRLVDAVNSIEPRLQGLSDEQLKAKTEEFRRRLALGETLSDIQAGKL